MNKYNIVLAHGPVRETRYLGNDTVSYILEDGKEFSIQFSIVNSDGKKMYKRLISENAVKHMDLCEWDIFDEGLTCEDFAQWTADNFSEEILDCLEAMPIVDEK